MARHTSASRVSLHFRRRPQSKLEIARLRLPFASGFILFYFFESSPAVCSLHFKELKINVNGFVFS